jgi:hypothetical protein
MSTAFRTGHAVAFLAGVVAAASVARIGGWWLDNVPGVGITMAVLFGIGFGAACRRVDGRRERAIALWAGSVVGIAVQLFEHGPGTIWPLVLVIGAVMTAVAVLAGTAVASMMD